MLSQRRSATLFTTLWQLFWSFNIGNQLQWHVWVNIADSEANGYPKQLIFHYNYHNCACLGVTVLAGGRIQLHGSYILVPPRPKEEVLFNVFEPKLVDSLLYAMI